MPFCKINAANRISDCEVTEQVSERDEEEAANLQNLHQKQYFLIQVFCVILQGFLGCMTVGGWQRTEKLQKEFFWGENFALQKSSNDRIHFLQYV